MESEAQVRVRTSELIRSERVSRLASRRVTIAPVLAVASVAWWHHAFRWQAPSASSPQTQSSQTSRSSVSNTPPSYPEFRYHGKTVRPCANPLSNRFFVVATWWVVSVLILSGVLRTQPMTPQGVHCPTAPVQRFEGRLPKLGDAPFLQCRCSEIKCSGNHNLGKEMPNWTLALATRMDVTPVVLVDGMRFKFVTIGDSVLSQCDFAPPIPPPISSRM